MSSANQLPILPFVSKSHEDFNQISQYASRSSAENTRSFLRKRPVGALYYRTRSIQSYKLPRRLKRGSLLKQRITQKKKEKKQSSASKEESALPRCRKHRRRKAQLATAYGTSSLGAAALQWSTEGEKHALSRLSTHLWHAKRFAMASRFGVVTAQRSSHHGLKAMDNYCRREKAFVHDQSYLIPLELRCAREVFMCIFQHLMDPACHIFDQWCSFKSFQAAEYRVFLYNPDQFPLGGIGPVQLCIRDDDVNVEDGDQHVQSWLWCDPSILRSVREAIQNVINTHGLETKRFALTEAPLSRMFLSGKSATETLRSLLVPFLSDPNSPPSRFFAHSTASAQRLNNVWKNGRILALELLDRRGGAVTSQKMEENSSKSCAWPANAANSPLWNLQQCSTAARFSHERQNEMTDNQSSLSKSVWTAVQKQLQMSNENQKPDMSSVLALLEKQDSLVQSRPLCPMILILHRRSNTAQDMHEQTLDGWSVVFPSQWASDFMCVSTAKGAVAIGVEELEHLQRREGVLSFPRDFPDVTIGKYFWEEKQNSLMNRQSRLPRGKRTKDDLTTLQTLCSSSTLPDRAVSTVRSKAYLQPFFMPPSQLCLTRETVASIKRTIATRVKSIPLPNPSIEALPPLPHITLVHCTVQSAARGLPWAGAAIYAPSQEDLLEYAVYSLAHKEKLQAKMKLGCAEGIQKSWKGVKISKNSVNDRVLVGSVTSGYHPHCNRLSTGALVICDAEKLHAMMRSHYELLGHPHAHTIVLFKNPRSSYLRPALIEYL